MVYSQIRTLISLLIILAVAALFLWGGAQLLGSVTGSAAPAPTATVPPATELPSFGATPRATATKGGPHKPATPTPSPTNTPPPPTATPKGPQKVFMTQTQSAANPSTTFPVGLDRLYCWVRTSALPPGATYTTFTWNKESPAVFLNNVGVQRYPGDVNGSWFPFSLQTAGKYRCDVVVNGQQIGSVHFTVGP